MKLRKRTCLVARHKRLEREIAQAQVRLEQRRRGLAAAQRAARTRELIALGGLGRIAGILDIDGAVLLGALLCAREVLGHPVTANKLRLNGARRLQAWSATGKDATWLEAGELASSASPEVSQAQLTRALITFGGIVRKAELGAEVECDQELLLGILDTVALGEGNPKKRERWLSASRGEWACGEEKSPGCDIQVRFAGPIPREVGKSLRDHGLRFKRKSRIWLGVGDPAVIDGIVAGVGGAVLYRQISTK